MYAVDSNFGRLKFLDIFSKIVRLYFGTKIKFMGTTARRGGLNTSSSLMRINENFEKKNKSPSLYTVIIISECSTETEMIINYFIFK